MGDTLFGKEVSGTSLETRGLAEQVSGEFSGLLSDPSQGANLIGQMFGINPSEMGLQDFASGIFDGSGQSSSFAAFDKANQPFQQRAQTQQQGQLASQFGTSGGRFSNNLSGAQAQGSALLEQGFDQNRLQFGQQQRGQDIQALLGTLGALPGLQNAALAPLAAAGGFANPGAPIWQQGIAGELLGATGAFFGGPAGTAAAGGIASGFRDLFNIGQ